MEIFVYININTHYKLFIEVLLPFKSLCSIWLSWRYLYININTHFNYSLKYYYLLNLCVVYGCHGDICI